MMDDHMPSPERWAAAYIVRKMPVLESHCRDDKTRTESHIAIMGKREKQGETGDPQHSSREAPDCNLFWQDRLN